MEDGMVIASIDMNDRFMGTKLLKGEVCRIVAYDNFNVVVKSLSSNEERVVPFFYFRETFKRLDENNQIIESSSEDEVEIPTLTQRQLESVMEITELVLGQLAKNGDVDEKSCPKILNLVAYNLVNIMGDN